MSTISPAATPVARPGVSVRLALLLVAAATVLGALLRFASFSDSLYGDELSAYFVVEGNGAGRLLDLVDGDQEVTPPLYFLLARLTQAIGDSLRWVPMAAGIATIPLTYLLGLWTAGRRAGVVAAAIVAASPFLVFYSTEGRPYALLMALALGSTLALLRALVGESRAWWALYALLSCAVMYTHYAGAFLLAGQAGWAIAFHARAWRWIVGANVAAAVAWLPWLPGYLADQDSPGSGLIGVLQPFGVDAFATDTLHWAVGHPLTVLSVHDVPGDRALGLMGLGLALGLAGLGADAVRRRLHPEWEHATLVLVLALSTPLLAGLYSAFGESVFLPRNLIASAPGLAVLLAAIVTAPGARALWVPATALLVAGFALAGLRMLEDASHRPAYADAAAFAADRGAGVVVDVPGPSPGPLTALDVASDAEPALRLGRPSHAAEWAADQPGGPGQFAVLPVEPPEAVARQAVGRAGGDPIALVHQGALTPEQLRADAGTGGAFVRALPRGYRVTATETYPGLFGWGTISVYELTPPGASRHP